jgi:hypothetical protein
LPYTNWCDSLRYFDKSKFGILIAIRIKGNFVRFITRK